MTQALGIDVGGTGVKVALVDVADATLVSSRLRAKTPRPSTPDAVALAIANLVEQIDGETRLAADLPVGCGLPGVIKDGRLMTAANIDKGWLDVSAEEIIGAALGRRVHAINDADAAGLAEMRFGAGRDCAGTVLLLTIGTGIGSALFVDGRLVPNTEFGHLEFKGRDAELRLSGVARERRRIRWRQWATEFNEYLARLELYVAPDLIILGGGVSKSIEKYRSLLVTRATLVPASFLNSAGIVGAAMAAVELARPGGDVERLAERD